MLTQIIRWSLERAWHVAALAAALFLAGAWYARDLPVEIFPTLAPAQMVVQTEAEGLVADQVEQIVTQPIETALIGAPGVASIRSESAPGLSIITLDLAKGVNPARARQTVAERLAQAAGALPAEVPAPRIAPLASDTGDLLQIGLTSDRLDAMALRDVALREIRPRLLSTAGVANVTVYGGRTRRIEVRARPGDLSDSDLGFLDVIDAVRRATSVTGAGFMDTPEQRVLIDPRGQALTTDAVGAGQIQIVGNAPTRITDVADVVNAPAPASGDALIMGKPGVLLGVSSQYGAGSLQTTRALQAAIDLLKPSLAARGVTVTVMPDAPARSIDRTLRGLVIGLLIAAAAVVLILLLVLGDIWAVLAALFSIAPTLMAALAVIKALGLTLNIMTLGGLFIASAIAIDDAVIDIESIVTRLRIAPNDRTSRVQAIFAALLEVRAPVVYATLLIDIALTPMVFLGGVFGPFLAPMAVTVIVASLASLAVAVCVTPATAVLLLRGLQPKPERALVAQLKAAYGRWIDHRCEEARLALAALVVTALAVAVILPLARRTDAPSFHDGRLIVHFQAPPSTSLEAVDRMGARLTEAGLSAPGVVAASETIGRDPTDFSARSTDQSDIEFDLRPDLSVADQERTQARLKTILAAYPGVAADIRTGLGPRQAAPEDRAPFAVSVYGSDLDQVDEAANRVAARLRGLAGAGDVAVLAGPRAPSVRVDLDFTRLAIYGLSAADVLETVQTAFSGKTVAQVYDNGRAVDLTVTGPEGLRRDPESIGDLLLRSSSGLSTPLKAVAKVYLTDARALVQHEAGQRREVVTAAPAPGRELAFARGARDLLKNRALPPPGVYLSFSDASGAAAQDRRALAANSLIAALAMIALLLLVFRDGRMAALILLSTMFAFFGGAAAMAVTGGVLSIGSIAGFIALFGLSTRTAILLVSRPGDVAAARKAAWTLDIVKETAVERAAPTLLTSLLVAVVMLPLALSGTGAGSEILGPMADVILGGAISGAVLTLLFLPALVHAYLCPFHRPGPLLRGGPGHHDHEHDHH